MKIPGNYNSTTADLKNTSPVVPQNNGQVAPKAPETQPATTVEDSVNISEASRLAKDVQAQLATFPEVDADRVAELKQKVQSGSYAMDSYALAGKIVMLEGMIPEQANGPESES